MMRTVSLPSRECGLKYLFSCNILHSSYVTPFAGVWIEIGIKGEQGIQGVVTPFAGVWIEINREKEDVRQEYVTPFAGVWIEICRYLGSLVNSSCHSLRGSVD